MWSILIKKSYSLEKTLIIKTGNCSMTKNIAFQSRFVNPRRETNHREFNEFLDRLDLIDQLLKCSGFELKFAQTYLDGLEALCGHPLDPKSVRRHTEYAVQALRCNILKMLLRQSLRQTSLLIAASPEFQTFCVVGDFCSAEVPSKSALHKFSKIVPGETLQEFNHLLIGYAASQEVRVFDLDPLDCKTLWMDATCLMATIHFPVDWILMRDAVRTLVKAILCIRNHGLKHRIPAPESFLGQINSLCMEMSGCRRQKETKKNRKAVLRDMKKVVNIVRKHAERYRDLLTANLDRTDLSKDEATQIIDRIENILTQLPAALKQAQARIIREEKVPSDEKILSFYDHSAKVIVRGKSGAEVEFGNELNIVEQQDGLVVDWQLFEKKTADADKLLDMMKHYPHQQFETENMVADRGYDSPRSRRILNSLGINNHIAARSPGEFARQLESDEFQRLHKRRSQTEPRIAAVKRFIGSRIPCKDFEFKKRHVGWAVLTHNLVLLARMVALARRENILLTAKSA